MKYLTTIFTARMLNKLPSSLISWTSSFGLPTRDNQRAMKSSLASLNTGYNGEKRLGGAGWIVAEHKTRMEEDTVKRPVTIESWVWPPATMADDRMILPIAARRQK